MVIPLFHYPVNITLGLTVCLAVPLVVQLLAFAQAQLQLHPTVLEIQGQRDQRHAILHDPGLQLHDLPLMHQQTAGSDRVFIEYVAMLIGADVHAADEQLPILHGAERILQIHLPRPNGLDLRPEKLYARLKALQHEILVKSLAVAADFLYAGLPGHSAHSPSITQQEDYNTRPPGIKEKFVNCFLCIRIVIVLFLQYHFC